MTPSDRLTFEKKPAAMQSQIEATTVGIFLCPNRGLTTLTAAILALHPDVQVMNHGFERLLDAGALKFLHSLDDRDLNRFVECAIGMSDDGRRGDYGGSILHSHAFDRPTMRTAYSQRYGEARIKRDIRCLIWKDGARFREFIKASYIDPVALADRFPRIRFISPMREPANHMRSIRTYYGTKLPDYVQPSLPDLSPESIADYIFSAHAEFLNWQKQRPSQFLAFSDNDIGPAIIDRFCKFFAISRDADWLQAATTLYVNDSSRATDAADRAAIESCLHQRFAGAEEIQRWYRSYPH